MFTAVASPTLFATPSSTPSTRLTWRSRSLWCPPALGRYALTLTAGRFLQLPWVLPLDADSLRYTCPTVDAALARTQDYLGKMLHKAAPEAVPCVVTLLRSGGQSGEA